jgi:Kef-type K+ transport system membrane component KefB
VVFPSEQDFALLLFQLFVLLSVALGLGELFRRFGQPTVIGEILAGVLLGPSVFGALAPQISTALFHGPQTQLLGSLAWLGSVFLLLVAGTEINFATLVQERRVVALTSLVGISVPFAAGFIVGLNLPDTYLIEPSNRLLFSLFLATALSISAIPLVAKILMDLKLLRTSVGQTILGSAVVNDLVGWILFAVILSTLASRADGHGCHHRDTDSLLRCRLSHSRSRASPQTICLLSSVAFAAGRNFGIGGARGLSLRRIHPVARHPRYLRRLSGGSHDR